MIDISIIKQFEGFNSKPYLCPAGIPTIGWGSTIYENGVQVKLNDKPITEKEGNELLLAHINKRILPYLIKYGFDKTLTNNQLSAIVSLIYNIGWNNFVKSTLLAKLIAEEYDIAANEFLKWIYGSGKKLPGLIKRREAERDLFLKP